MNIVEKLDLAIKSKEIGTTEGFHTVPYKGGIQQKQTYMTNDEWDSFLSAMSEVARNEYGNGDGDELKEKDGRPPKMASYDCKKERQTDSLHHQGQRRWYKRNYLPIEMR